MKFSFRFNRLLLSAVLPAAIMSVSPAVAASSLTITTQSGPVTGSAANGLQSWLGLPYAAPPVGELRWQPPQPVKHWVEPRNVQTLASSCAQNGILGDFARAGGSEDCLYLNVYRNEAEVSAGNKRPVFVWIHGGGLQVGQGGDYDPSQLATQGKAVVVTLNYRLGVFGFLANSALDKEGHDFANYGLMDQQAALRWVKQNISAFGGDPDNVTIGGESSGGNSVMAHIASPRSAGLFQHAVAMSGGGIMAKYPAFGSPRPLDVALKTGNDFAKALGCDANDADCLRSLSTSDILKVQNPYALNEFVIDGKILPEHPGDAFRKGNFNPVTLVSGSNRDEGRFFVAVSEHLTGKTPTEETYPQWIEQQFGRKLAPAVMKEYPISASTDAVEAFSAAATDSMFSCPGRAMHSAISATNPVYAYEFSDRTAPSYISPTTFPMLAAHTFELAYVFPGFHGGSDAKITLNPLQAELSRQMVAYFADGSTMKNTEHTWPRFDPAKNNYMTFVLPSSRMISGHYTRTHHCDFWDKTGIY
ncbi:TPA: carboxylesterase family protein [Enterobacter hormaechei subsp. steigerwaltii]|nr:carboxylesterase family protein [Enterobacter hormaechei subsp. steigerwaltii]